MRFQTAKEVAETLQTWLHESESGREYSRISALMAAAMRAKQSPPSDGAAAKPEPANSADLELVFLDDERKPASGPAEGKTAESDRSGIAKAAAAAAKSKERKPAGSDSGARARGEVARPACRRRDRRVVRSADGRRRRSGPASLCRPSAVQAQREGGRSEVALALDRSGGSCWSWSCCSWLSG